MQVMPSQQIQQRKQKYPHNIDEVPVKPDHLNRTVILRIKTQPEGKDNQVRQQPGADDHVERVHAGHREVDPVKHLDLFHISAFQQVQFVRIFVAVLRYHRIERIAGKQTAGNQVIVILVAVLLRLDAEKCQTQNQRDNQTQN